MTSKNIQMTNISSYLTFNGNCREAMMFYKKCLGGELTLQTIGESPLSEKLPKKMKECIVHSTLKKGSLILMASDMVDDDGFRKGNSISLMLNCTSEEEANQYYTNLSEGGEPTHPLEISFWGSLFGDLKDKFGNQWLINFQIPNK